MTIQAGQYVTDGTAVFIIDDVRDGFRVGDIVFRPTLHDGFIKANGAQVKASEYPRLLKYAQDNNLIVEDNSTDKTKYMYDAGADTLTLPDAQGRVLQGTTDNVKEIGGGLPNITGKWGVRTTANNGGLFKENEIEGCYAKVEGAQYAAEAGSSYSSLKSTFYGIRIDASRCSSIYGASATVQPPALALIPQIKY